MDIHEKQRIFTLTWEQGPFDLGYFLESADSFELFFAKKQKFPKRHQMLIFFCMTDENDE